MERGGMQPEGFVSGALTSSAPSSSSQPAGQAAQPTPTDVNVNGHSDDVDTETAADEDADTDESLFSDVGDAGSTEVVFVREGVAVRPTPHECIMGRLSLVKQHCVMFLAWLPYSHGSLLQDGTFQVVHEGNSRPVPAGKKDIKAIQRRTPALGWHYIVVVLVSGLTLPPLYFNKGGIRSLIQLLKQHCFLVKCTEDPSTYLVNDTADPLQRSLTSLDLTDILLGAPPRNSSTTFAPPQGPLAEAWQEADGPTWFSVQQLGETLTRVTQCVKDTTQSWFGVIELRDTEDALDELAVEASEGAGPLAESRPHSAAIAVPLPRSTSPAHALAPADALDDYDDCGSIAASPDPSSSCPLHSHPRLSSSGDVREQATTSVGTFELLEGAAIDTMDTARRRIRPPPLSTEEWGTFFDAEGRMCDEAGFRQRVFYSGIEPGLRKEAWKFLLDVYPRGSTAEQRGALMQRKRRDYETLRSQWQSMTAEQEARNGKWRERRSRVDKDVRRTDRALPFYAAEKSPNLKTMRRILLTYTMYNFDLGYCQGMSDLVSPLLHVIRDEAETFWCFSAMMERLEGNFHHDQRGMHAQLLALRRLLQVLDPQLYAHFERCDCLNFFFAFRWVLIHFKREFVFEEVPRLWEALWSRYPSEHMHLYMCVAQLVHHRRAIMETCHEFDAVLKFCIELSGRMDLDQTLRLAEALCGVVGPAGKDCLEGL